MYQSIIDKLESEKVAKRAVAPIQVPVAESVQPKPVVVAESKPEVKKVSFKDKVKRLQAASNKVRKPVHVEVKKKRNIVELW